MTKEELKREAREWIRKNSKEFITNPKYSPFDYAEAIYLASAEPREKRIAELAQALEENAKLKKALSGLVYVVRLGKNELAARRMLAEAKQLLDGSKINPDDRYEITEKGKDYCCGGDGDIDCQSWCDYPSEEEIQDDSVIAWKEIILPEEIKEK